jgi:hypothetical protein
MIAVDRCSCTCTDGCISKDCECKKESLKNFCKKEVINEEEAFLRGWPEQGWYKNDLLQENTQLPTQQQIQIFECCKGK